MPDPLPQLDIAIRHAARAGRSAEDVLRELAIAAGVDLLATQQAACRAGIWPARAAWRIAISSWGSGSGMR